MARGGKSQISTFSGGINMDLDKGLLKPNQYRYAENIRTITNEGATTGALTNIESSVVVKLGTDVFLDGESIIGTTTVRNIGVVFTSQDSGNSVVNRIYRVDFINGDLSPIYTNVISIDNEHLINFNIPSDAVLSIVGRYEDVDNIKVYWADGTNFIRVINIAPSNDSNNNSIDSATMFDIVPSATLKVPSVVSIGSGRLNAGLIQYCYQLYSPSGSETEVSPMSPTIQLTDSNMDDLSIKYIGDGLGDIYGKPAGKSVKISITLPTDNKFTRVKLMSVYYFNYSEVPVITIVVESDILTEAVDGKMYFVDGGTETIGELTQAEFNLIGGNIFIPNYIESKNNILFAANTKESTWDLSIEEYDTRSYQFSSGLTGGIRIPLNPTTVSFVTTDRPGYVGLTVSMTGKTGVLSDYIHIGDYMYSLGSYTSNYNASYIISTINDETNTIIFGSPSWGSSFDIGDILTISEPFTWDVSKLTKISSSSGIDDTFMYSSLNTVPVTHDCIHSEIYTEDRYSDLLYTCDKDGNPGGSGLNVDYLFVNTYFIESYGDYYNKRTELTNWSNRTDEYIDKRTARIGDKKRSISSLNILDSTGSFSSLNLSDLGLPTHDGFLNYANPYLSNNIKSYQRDEIYRFAAVFYDEKGRKTPAKWIADIRFPAGYIESTDWNSNIFEVPEEIINMPYSGTFLERQELLVKPLGIKFTFRNIPSNVSKVEIVRAKRDINNKTIYAQGVVQKVGTYQTEYKQGHWNDNGYIINGGIPNTLRPHPIISMGYSYSIAGPVRNSHLVDHSVDSSVGAYSDSLNYSWQPFVNNPYNIDADQSRVGTNYTDHASSPYFYYKNSLLFINPEVSYYGVDFTEQLKNVLVGMETDIIDIIYPISTPNLLIDSPGSSWGVNYYGNDENVGFQFKPSTKVYPFGMFFGADINSRNYSKSMVKGIHAALCTMGLVSADYRRIDGGSSMPSIDNGAIPRSDINNMSTGVFTERADRPFISVGGAMLYDSGATYYFKNGFYTDPNGANDFSTDSNNTALIKDDTASNMSYNGFTFKYFNRYAKNSNVDNYTKFIYQLSSNVSDYVSFNIDSLDTKKTDLTTNVFSGITGTTLSKKVKSFDYSGNILVGTSIDKLDGSQYVSSGAVQYLNHSATLTTGNEADQWSSDNNSILQPLAKTKSHSPHGDGLILNFDDSEQIPTIVSLKQDRNKYNLTSPNQVYDGYKVLDTIGSTGLSTFVVNLKSLNSSIYGGAGLLDRQFTEYISTGVSFDTTGDDITKVVFGGDTFIGIFDYTIDRCSDPYVDYGSDSNEQGRGSVLANQTRYIGALIPLESSINMHLVNSKSYVSDNYNFAIQKDPGVYSPGANEGSNWKYTQTYPQFSYNSAYSSENTGVGFLSKLLITKDNRNFDCRIWSSQPKTNNEVYDSWSQWKVADYLDVDTQFGEITGMRKFKDKLFFWQKNAFGVATTNERSLIKDNNISTLVLGSAGILTRFDYISNANGFKKGVVGGIAESESSLYWYDVDNAVMCIFDNQLSELSKIKGIQTMLNKNKYNITNHIPIIYDKKYNEILLTLYGLQGADTIV